MRMTKPQLHRHLTTGIFNQLSKILKKFRLSDFFLDRAAGKFQQVLELCALCPHFLGPVFRLSANPTVFSATKPEYQVLVGMSTSGNFPLEHTWQFRRSRCPSNFPMAKTAPRSNRGKHPMLSGVDGSGTGSRCLRRVLLLSGLGFPSPKINSTRVRFDSQDKRC